MTPSVCGWLPSPGTLLCLGQQCHPQCPPPTPTHTPPHFPCSLLQGQASRYRQVVRYALPRNRGCQAASSQ